jgi:hypothetical protein
MTGLEAMDSAYVASSLWRYIALGFVRTVWIKRLSMHGIKQPTSQTKKEKNAALSGRKDMNRGRQRGFAFTAISLLCQE